MKTSFPFFMVEVGKHISLAILGVTKLTLLDETFIIGILFFTGLP